MWIVLGFDLLYFFNAPYFDYIFFIEQKTINIHGANAAHYQRH